MAEWKKVIVSGSNADLAEVTASGGFIGDGSAITGLVEASLANDAVTNAKLANITRGSVKVGGASNAPTDLAAKTSGQILVGDGTDIVSVAVSGDVSLAANGAVTIANTAVENAMIGDGAVDTEEIADNAVSLAKMAGLARGKIIHGDSSGNPAALAAGGANTVLQSDGTDITYNTVATAMIADNAVSLAKMSGLARGKIIAGDSSGDPAALAPGGANTVLQSDGTDITYNTVATAMIADNAVSLAKMAGLARGKIIAGDSSGDPVALAAGGANTVLQSDGTDITYNTVATAMIADNAVDGDKLADSFTVANSVAAKNFTASMGVSASHFSASTDIIASGNIITTSGSFVGSGADLTGITVADNAITLAKMAGLARGKLIVGDSSGDPSALAAGGANTVLQSDGTDITYNTVATAMIADNAVSLAKMSGLARGKIIAGDSSGDPAALAAGGANTVLQSDGTDISYNTVATAMIADNAVSLAKMAGLARGKIIAGDSSGDPAALALGSANTVLQSDGTDLSYGTIATNMIANDAVTGDKLANDITIANDLTVTRDLIVNGTSVTVNTANLNVEDPFILLKSGSSNTSDSGIIFGGSTGTANTGKALVWDASYNSNDGRLAVSTTAVAGDATANFDGSGTAGYYVAGVFAGSEADAATAKADHAGNIRIESSEIFIYV